MVVVPLSQVMTALARQPKYYFADELSRQTLFNARAGRPICHVTARRILAIARERVSSDIIGLQLSDGTKVYMEGIVEALQSQIAQLEAEVARLRPLESKRWRELVTEGRLSPSTLNSKPSSN